MNLTSGVTTRTVINSSTHPHTPSSSPAAASSMSASVPSHPPPPPHHKSSLFRGLHNKPTNAANGNNNTATVNRRAVGKYNSEMEVEQENDSIINALTSDMTRLKEEARHLQQEVFSQNQLLEKLQDFMQSARDGVVGSVGRIDSVMSRYGFKHTVFFALVACGVMILFFYGIKYSWSHSGGGATLVAVAEPSTNEKVLREERPRKEDPDSVVPASHRKKAVG